LGPILELKDSLEKAFSPLKTPGYAHNPGPFEVPGLRKILGETLWWCEESFGTILSRIPGLSGNIQGFFLVLREYFPPTCPDTLTNKRFRGIQPRIWNREFQIFNRELYRIFRELEFIFPHLIT
jgi:hypothetical protein